MGRKPCASPMDSSRAGSNKCVVGLARPFRNGRQDVKHRSFSHSCHGNRQSRYNQVDNSPCVLVDTGLSAPSRVTRIECCGEARMEWPFLSGTRASSYKLRLHRNRGPRTASSPVFFCTKGVVRSVEISEDNYGPQTSTVTLDPVG